MPLETYRGLDASLRRSIEKAGKSGTSLDTVFVMVPSSKSVEGGDGFYINHKGKAGFYFKDEESGKMVEKELRE